MMILTLLLAVTLAAMHILTAQLRFLDVTPRSRWLSFAGGTASAYVVLHILPELGAHQDSLSESLGINRPLAEILLYGMTLLGLLAFYGLERAVKRSGNKYTPDDAPAKIFWVHIASFAFYNLLIGYLLLHREDRGVGSLAIYGLAMALHFVTNDYGLRQHHRGRYDRQGRWTLAAAVVAGWAAGLSIDVHEATIAALFAFLAGGILLNVFKEELPEERESRILPFIAGSVVTAVLLAAS